MCVLFAAVCNVWISVTCIYSESFCLRRRDQQEYGVLLILCAVRSKRTNKRSTTDGAAPPLPTKQQQQQQQAPSSSSRTRSHTHAFAQTRQRTRERDDRTKARLASCRSSQLTRPRKFACFRLLMPEDPSIGRSTLRRWIHNAKAGPLDECLIRGWASFWN